jgi:hypothetical protein
MKIKQLISSAVLTLSLAPAAFAEYLKVNIISVEHIAHMDLSGGSEPYVKWTAGEMWGETRVISVTKSDRRAEFNYEDAFDSDKADRGELTFIVKEKDGLLNIKKVFNKFKARQYGTATINLHNVTFVGNSADIRLDLAGEYNHDAENQQTYLKVRLTKLTGQEYIAILENRKK